MNNTKRTKHSGDSDAQEGLPARVPLVKQWRVFSMIYKDDKTIKMVTHGTLVIGKMLRCH